MPQISEEKTSFCCRKNFQKKKLVQAAFRQGFNQVPPCKKIFQKNVTKYLSHGMSLKRNKKKFWKIKDCSFWREHWISQNDFRKQSKFDPNLYWQIWQACWIKLAEVVPRRCSSKQMFNKDTANLQENTHEEVWF